MREGGKGNLCSLFENAFVTTDLTGGPCGIRNVVRGCAPDFSARKTSAWQLNIMSYTNYRPGRQISVCLLKIHKIRGN